MDLQDKPDDGNYLREEINSYALEFIGISCNSCYSYLKTKYYCDLIKQISPDIYVFAGGQHIGAIAETAIQELSNLDCIVKYEGEYATNYILENEGRNLKELPGIIYRDKGQIHKTKDERIMVDLDKLPLPQWSLYPDFKKMVPNIELSRGCKSVCSFCTNYYAYGFNYRSKSAKRILEEVQFTLKEYGNEKQMIYFGAMTFDLQDDNLKKLVQLLAKQPVNWRTESRVDVLSMEDVKKMANVGLKALDWGLDAVSPEIIKIMNKSKNPQIYIENAVELLTKLKEVDVINKINLMFYPGETAETLAQTLQFFMNYREIIDIVSPKPTMLYPGTILEKQYPSFGEKYGTSKVQSNFWNSVHAYPLNPSYQISYSQAKNLSLLLERIINKYEFYYKNRLSSIGYNNLSKTDYFKLLFEETDIYDLRFQVDKNSFESMLS
ncbi:hypothetical protein ES707_15995 [subsurface metagenome]